MTQYPVYNELFEFVPFNETIKNAFFIQFEDYSYNDFVDFVSELNNDDKLSL